jgi:CheY-like chemotaxis protein
VGFEVVEAGSGEAALEALDARGDEVRLVVCDLVLPGLGGAEVLNHARQVAPGAAVLQPSEASCRQACCDAAACDGYAFDASSAAAASSSRRSRSSTTSTCPSR